MMSAQFRFLYCAMALALTTVACEPDEKDQKQPADATGSRDASSSADNRQPSDGNGSDLWVLDSGALDRRIADTTAVADIQATDGWSHSDGAVDGASSDQSADSSLPPDAAPEDFGPCLPTTCLAQRAQCGVLADGCGNELDCGTCTAPESCGGAGQNNQCGCSPGSCLALGAECGTIDDGCGGSLDCGSCLEGSCGGNGLANLCADPLPPDPATIAPTIDRTGITDFFSLNSFLYTAPNPVQTEVLAQELDPRRAAIVRGRIVDRGGNAVSGVRVHILGRPEFGRTQSRADGQFDMMVNGGQRLVVRYQRPGYLTVDRPTTPPWRAFAGVEEVVLLPLDSWVTSLDLSGQQAAVQIAKGSRVEDSSGARQPTLLVLPGTTAELHFAAGEPTPLASCSLRLTEYTVGASGPAAMPAPLPPQSAYTHALELSCDECQSQDCSSVVFTQPVFYYLQNFLQFPVGTTIPNGLYNRQLAAWVPSANGRVIQLLASRGGQAIIDSDGDGVSDDLLSQSSEERALLAQLYQPGDTLWRVPLEHFSPADANVPPAGSWDDDSGDDGDDPDSDNDCEEGGCVVENLNQILGERVPISGSNMFLAYRSDRVPGRRAKSGIVLPLTGQHVPQRLKRIEVQLNAAGQQYEETITPQPDLLFSYNWDQMDAYGRLLQGAQKSTVRVGFVFDGFYSVPSDSEWSFGNNSQTGLTLDSSRNEFVFWRQRRLPIGGFDATATGLGGWTLSEHHFYDPGRRTVYLGNGRRLSAQVSSNGKVVSTAAGIGVNAFSGDGGPAVLATINRPVGLAVDSSGTLFIADSNNARIRAVSTDGHIDTIAGGGSDYDSNNIAATDAQLSMPMDVVFGADGLLYIADVGRLRMVDSNGLIQTVAGGGDNENCHGIAATDCRFDDIYAVITAADNTLYIADASDHKVYRITPDRRVFPVAGRDGDGYSGDGGPATQAQLNTPVALALAEDGSLFIADYSNHVVRRVAADGVITTFAGTGEVGYDGDGGPAELALLDQPMGLALHQGDLYIAEFENNRVRVVSGTGLIGTAVGNGVTGYSGENKPAQQAHLSGPRGLAIAPNGDLYVADSMGHRVFRVVNTLPDYTVGDVAIATPDGRRLFLFNQRGQHQATYDTNSGATLFTFDYENGLLSSITDASSNVTSVERDGNGQATAIVAPRGQRTKLTFDSNNMLHKVSNPLDQEMAFEYSDSGLLTKVTDADQQDFHFSYDNQGRLTAELDPLGDSKQWSYERLDLLNRLVNRGYRVRRSGASSDTATHFHIEKLPSVDMASQQLANYLPSLPSEVYTALDLALAAMELNPQSDIDIESLAADWTYRAVTYPSGKTQRSLLGSNGWLFKLLPNRTLIAQVTGPDPRFGMSSPVPTALRLITPDRLVHSISVQRDVTLGSADDHLSLAAKNETITVNGRSYQHDYDAASGVWTEQTPAGRTMSVQRNAANQVQQSQYGWGLATWDFAYDSYGNVTEASSGDRIYSYSYNNQGLLSVATDPLSRSLQQEYDAAGRLTMRRRANGEEIGIGYDAMGRQNQLTLPSGASHTFVHNARGELIHYLAPAVAGVDRQTTFAYDSQGRLTHTTLPGGAQVSRTYNAAVQLEQLQLPRGTYTFVYDAETGQRTGITDPEGNSVNYSYNGFMPTSESWSGDIAGSVNRTQDLNFRDIAVTVNSEPPILYEYDADGLVVLAGLELLTRDSDTGRVTDTAVGQVRQDYTYNEHGELASQLAYRGLSNELLQRTYQRNHGGQITAVTETINGSTADYTYEYDAVGQLTRVTQDSTEIEAYSYDSNGNRTSSSNLAGSFVGTYDAQDRLLSYGDTSFSYNDMGQRTGKQNAGQVTSYVYDTIGNLLQIDLPDGTQISYLVDAIGRRIGKKVNGTLVKGWLYRDGLSPIAELDENGQVQTIFVYGTRHNVPDYLVRDGVYYKIISDQLGSPRLVVRSGTGQVLQQMDYDAFGRVLADSNPGFTPFGFAGGHYDPDTGLLRFGARDYDAEVGRWTAKDPQYFRAGDTNLYGYVQNNPVNLLDSTGFGSDIGAFAGGSYYSGVGGGMTVYTNGCDTVVCIQVGVGVGAGVDVGAGNMPESGTMTLNVESSISVGGLGVSGKASIDTQGNPSASLNVDTPLGSVGTSDAKLPTGIPSNLNPEASTKGYLEYCY